MANVYTYHCRNCRVRVTSGATCWECTHCGHELILLGIRKVIPAPGIPPSTEEEDITEMMHDVFAGFDDLLGRQ